MRGSRAAYFEAAKKRRKLKELQNTEGTVERADYLNSPKGLAVETIKGVGRILDTPFRKGRELLEKLESNPKPLRRRRKGHGEVSSLTTYPECGRMFVYG